MHPHTEHPGLLMSQSLLQVKQQEAAAFSRSMKGVGGRLQGA